MIKEIFHIGKWTSAEGNTEVFTEKDLDNIASSFNEKTGRNSEGREVPLVPGHPKTDTPAIGWVKRVWRDGGKLFAEFKDVIEKARNAIDQKAFKDVSIALSKGTLRHIGLLNFPAVAGMGAFKFEGNDKFDTYTFSEPDEKGILAKFKDYFKTEDFKNTLKSLNTQFTQPNEGNMAEIDDLKRNNDDLKVKNTELEAKFSESGEKIKSLELKFGEKEKAFTELEKKHNALNESITKDKEAGLDKADADFCDQLIEKRLLLKVNRDDELYNLKTRRTADEVSFTDGDGKTVKQTAVDAYKEKLSKAPEVLIDQNFSQGKERPTGKDAVLQAKVKEYMEKHEVSYSIASDKIFEMHPELTEGGNNGSK